MLEAHDMFATEEGELKHEIVTGGSPSVREPICRVPFALRTKVTGLVH